MLNPYNIQDTDIANADIRPQLRINLQSLIENYRTLKACTQAHVACVVKADAYGLGLIPVTETLIKADCHVFFVAFTAEGVILRRHFPDIDIYVLSPLVEKEAKVLQSHRLQPCLFNMDGIHLWRSMTPQSGLSAPCALHVETGINRLGLVENDLRAFMQNPSLRAALDFTLIMGHLACADEPDAASNQLQLERFQTIRQLFPDVPASLCNSAGIFLGQAYHYDLVRPGIALYGHDPHYSLTKPRVKPVATFEATIAQIKNLLPGDSVGYGATYQCTKEQRIAVVVAGYADGLLRCLFNPLNKKAFKASIGGYRVPIIGRVSMDMIVLDVTEVPMNELETGDRVEFFGGQIAIEEIAEFLETIPYEILTRVGSRVRREYESLSH